MFWTMFDPMYWLIIAPGLILAGIATWMTKSAFAKNARIRSSSGMTGAQAAMHMLRQAGVSGVRIEPTQGMLSDHYDPRSRTLRLSRGVYGSDSLSAVGIACHEAGHAIQHARHFAPLAIRSALVPLTTFGSSGAYIFILAGILFSWPGLMKIGVLLFGVAVLFSIVTLPVEWDASARAKKALVASGIVSPQERSRASEVLNAAFLTYVASAVTALLTLLYYLLRLGLLGGDD